MEKWSEIVRKNVDNFDNFDNFGLNSYKLVQAFLMNDCIVSDKLRFSNMTSLMDG